MKEPPVPPSYEMATSLPSYEEAEQTKQEEMERLQREQENDSRASQVRSMNSENRNPSRYPLIDKAARAHIPKCGFICHVIVEVDSDSLMIFLNVLNSHFEMALFIHVYHFGIVNWCRVAVSYDKAT